MFFSLGNQIHTFVAHEFYIWLVVSNIFYFHNIWDNPSFWLMTNMFEDGLNHQPDMFYLQFWMDGFSSVLAGHWSYLY